MLNFNIKSTTFKIFLVIAFLIAYGHLYPFEFKDLQTSMTEFRTLLLEIVLTNIPDMASNIFMFIPFGFVGARSFHTPLRFFLHSIQIIILGFIFAYLLQISQLFVEGRVPSLLDALLNTAGCAFGAFAGTATSLRFFGGQRGKELWTSAPMLLAGCLALYMTLPMTPALDIATLKKSFDPLFVEPSYSYVSIFKYTTFWLVFVQLVSAARRENVSMLQMLIFVGVLLLSQIIIASKQIGYSLLIGTAISIIAWFFLKRVPSKIIIAVLVLLLFIYQSHYALYPFRFGSHNSDFNWLPFHGLMNNDILTNTIVFFRKIFVFGSFMLFLEGLGLNWLLYTAIGVLWIGAMEVLQINLDGEGHVPEITDPLFVLLIAFWLRTFRDIKYRPERRDYSLRGRAEADGSEQKIVQEKKDSKYYIKPSTYKKDEKEPKENRENKNKQDIAHASMASAKISLLPETESEKEPLRPKDISEIDIQTNFNEHIDEPIREEREKTVQEGITEIKDVEEVFVNTQVLQNQTLQTEALQTQAPIDAAENIMLAQQDRKPEIVIASLFILYLIFIIYGSLVPFTLEHIPFKDAWIQFSELKFISISDISKIDWLTNILLGVPASFMGMAIFYRNTKIALTLFTACTIFTICLATSWTAEFLQIFFASRTPSINDIAAQTIGAGIGFGCWFIFGKELTYAAISFFKKHSLSSKYQYLFWSYIIVVLIYNIMPLDLSLNPIDIYHKWKDGLINFVPFGLGSETRMTQLYSTMINALIWIPPAFFLVRYEKFSSFISTSTIFFTALIIKALQLIVISRLSDITDLITALIGASLGSLIGRIGMADNSAEGDTASRPCPANTQSPSQTDMADNAQLSIQLIFTAIFYFSIWAIIVLLLYWFPYDFVSDKSIINEHLSNFSLIPFHTYYKNGVYYAFMQILGILFFFVPNGFLLSYLIKGGTLFASRINKIFICLWLASVCSVAGLVVLGQFLLPERVPDITDVLTGCLGCWVGFTFFSKLYIYNES